jgi:hypothetical protein
MSTLPMSWCRLLLARFNYKANVLVIRADAQMSATLLDTTA